MDSAGKAFAGVVSGGAMMVAGGYFVTAIAVAALGMLAVALLAAVCVGAFVIALGYSAIHNRRGLFVLGAVMLSGSIGFVVPLIGGRGLVRPLESVFESGSWTRIVPLVLVYGICSFVLPFIVIGGTALAMMDSAEMRNRNMEISLIFAAPLAVLPWAVFYASEVQDWEPMQAALSMLISR